MSNRREFLKSGSCMALAPFLPLAKPAYQQGQIGPVSPGFPEEDPDWLTHFKKHGGTLRDKHILLKETFIMPAGSSVINCRFERLPNFNGEYDINCNEGCVIKNCHFNGFAALCYIGYFNKVHDEKAKKT